MEADRSCISQEAAAFGQRLGQEPGKDPRHRLFSCPSGLLCYPEGMDDFVAIIGNRIMFFQKRRVVGGGVASESMRAFPRCTRLDLRTWSKILGRVSRFLCLLLCY